MYGFTSISTKGDIEEGTLYPGLDHAENKLRWGFIRKVYGILVAQMVLTTIVSSVTVLYAPVNDLLRGNSALMLLFLFMPLFSARTMQSLEPEGSKKRKKGRDSEKKKKVKFVKYDLEVDSDLEEQKYMFDDKDCSSGDSDVENPLSEDDV